MSRHDHDPAQIEAALAARRAQVEAKPASAVAEHNLAALLGDTGRPAEAEAAVRRAFNKGGDAPETWLVLARALLNQGDYDGAEAAFRQTLSRRPLYVDAVRELSQLIWMQTADFDAALAPVEAAMALAQTGAAPASPSATMGALSVVRARLMEYAGQSSSAIWTSLMDARVTGDAAVELAAAHAALDFDLDRALGHARTATALAPNETGARLKLAEVHLARDEPAEALVIIDAVLAAAPDDQSALGLQATARRLIGDPQALSPDDYAALVRSYAITVPPGWATLSAYLADLAVALRRLHALRTHPIGQSLRHGTQTTDDLRTNPDPAIRAFFTAIDAPIRAHLAHLGSGEDSLRRRNTGDYRLAGCWSVQLRPGGFHAPHFHPKGWLSSACYIDLPDAIEGEDRQGWIGFGAPPFASRRSLPPEHYEKPAPGKLVLFPSWMWHGTVPFTGAQPRLSMAFDVVPA